MRKNGKDRMSETLTIFEELINGICELVYVDVHSVEHTVSVTRSLIHLPDSFDESHEKWKSSFSNKYITVWNLVEEKWQKILFSSIIDCERLTGNGIKNENS